MALTWSGSIEKSWIEEEEEFLATTRAPLQTVITAAEATDAAAFEDLQRRLNAAILEVEQGRAREAVLLKRALKSEQAEEALASQMADLEAEAFTRITQASKLLSPATASHVELVQLGELTMRLQLALKEADTWARRCQDLEKEAEEARVREAAYQRRAETAEAAEEALASQMAVLEAEAFTHITKNASLVERCVKETEPITRSQVEELERRLAATGKELEAVRAKLHQAEEKSRWLEMRAGALEEEKEVKLKSGDDTLLSLSLEDLAGVKLKLWSPSSLALTSY